MGHLIVSKVPGRKDYQLLRFEPPNTYKSLATFVSKEAASEFVAWAQRIGAYREGDEDV